MKSKTLIIAVGAIVFIVAMAFAYVDLRNRDKESSQLQPNTSERRMPVVIANAREMLFEERVQVSGNVEAKNTALVSARISGVLEAIFAEEGDLVTAGQKLFQTDKEKVSRALETAQQQVTVAAASVRAQQATVARVQASLDKAQLDHDRYKCLYEQDHAISEDAFEIQEARLKQAKADLSEETARLELAQAQELQAKSSLAIAQKDLADTLVASPIRGRISKRILEPGEMAGAGTPVLRVDDLSVVEITAYLPEAYYTRVTEGSTVLLAKVQGVDVGQVVITTKSPTIQPKLRTFEIKALLLDPPAGVVPGARADLSVILQKRQGLGVPRTAVLRRGQGLALFTVQDGKAHMLTVETGLESDGWVEVHAEGLVVETPVVCMGQDRLNNETSVVEVKEGAE